jgi:hypothetical protein
LGIFYTILPNLVTLPDDLVSKQTGRSAIENVALTTVRTVVDDPGLQPGQLQQCLGVVEVSLATLDARLAVQLAEHLARLEKPPSYEALAKYEPQKSYIRLRLHNVEYAKAYM